MYSRLTCYSAIRNEAIYWFGTKFFAQIFRLSKCIFLTLIRIPKDHNFGTGQLNHDRRICVVFIGMKWMFKNPSHIS